MERISVCVRARGGDNSVVDVGASVVTVNGSVYKVDRAFDPSASQADVYDSVAKKVIEGIMIGLNGTIFAYGQTGSGKTHTMVGSSALRNLSLMKPEDQGIIPRAINDLFNFLLAKQDKLTKESFRYEMTIHYLQLYNEEWFDLLGSNTKLLFRPLVGINAKRVVVTSTEEALQLLAEGWGARRTAETAMNRTSSRSHCVFVIELKTEELVDDLVQCRTSKLCLVDLAGSERVGQNGVEKESTQFKEGNAINKSLTYLATVMRQLSEKAAVVSYRNSPLTYYLKDSLGGNARTSIVVTIHSGKSYLTNIVTSLQFAQCCRTIKNNLQINMRITGETVIALNNRVNLLNQQLQQGILEARIEAETRIEELQDKLVGQKQLVAKRDAEIDSLKTKLQFEAERPATLRASLGEIRRSMQRRDLDFGEAEAHNTPEHVQVAQQRAFIDEENKENDLEVENDCLRQRIEDKNREILELKDEINKGQVEAKGHYDELLRRCDDLQRKNVLYETTIHSEKEQSARLDKEKENLQLHYGKLKSVNIQLEEKCKILEANNIKLEEKAEQEREEFDQELIQKEKDFQFQITALEEKHRNMVTSLEEEKDLLDLELSQKKDKLEDLLENFRVKQERAEAAFNKEKELSHQEVLQLKELYRSQTEDLRKKNQAELESLEQRQAYANKLHEESIQRLQKEFDMINTSYEDEHKKRQSLDVQLSSLETKLQSTLLRNQSLEEQIKQYEARLKDLEQSGSRERLPNMKLELRTKELIETKNRLVSGSQNHVEKVREMQRLLGAKAQRKAQMLSDKQEMATADKNVEKVEQSIVKLPRMEKRCITNESSQHSCFDTVGNRM